MGKKNKKRRLDALAASLQRQFGPRALRRAQKPAQSKPDVPHTPTGFPDLDQALGVSGLPRGRITECIGAYTSGKTTVVLKAVAEATDANDLVAVIDLERTFNPDYARRAGVDLSRVLLPPAGPRKEEKRMRKRPAPPAMLAPTLSNRVLPKHAYSITHKTLAVICC